jgi:hypothetical protein
MEQSSPTRTPTRAPTVAATARRRRTTTESSEPFQRCRSAKRAGIAAAWMVVAAVQLALGTAVVVAQEMQYPLALAVGPDQTIYIADRDLPGVWQFRDGQLSAYFTGSKKFRTPLNAVRCLAIDAEGRLLAGDSSTREVYRFDAAAQPQPLTNGHVGIPMALAVAADGSIIAADIEIQRLVKIPAAGGEVAIVAELPAVRGLAFDGEQRLWAVSHGRDAVVRFSADLQSREVLVMGQPFQFSHHLAFAADGTPAVIDGYAKTLWKISGGAVEPIAKGEPFVNPVGLAWKEDAWLVADPRKKAVFRVTPAGEVSQLIPPPQ